MKLFICLFLSLLAATTASAQSVDTATATPADSNALLRPGDVVRLQIWREPDLSGDFPVDEQGVVVFPKLGPRNVVHESAISLKTSLIRDYQVYLRNPSIDVILLRRINVLGAVKLPGLYPVDPTMTLADVIAAAGGATPLGQPDRAELLRDGKTVQTKLGGNTRMADLALRSGDQIYVPERSWFTRNSGVIAAAITASVSLMIALIH